MIALWALWGCLAYEDGRAAEGEAACRLREACDQLAPIGYDHVDACITAATNQDWVDCDGYSERRMQECVEAWESAVEAESCELLTDPPDVCAQVCGG